MAKGYIKLHRIFTDWEWYKNPNMVHFFVHCLLRANHKVGSYRGIEIAPGQFISGRKQLSEETGLTEQNIRTCIKWLKSTNELTSTPTKGVDGKYTLFEVINWEKYQSEDEPTKGLTSAPTTGQPRGNQRVTTNKNEKNVKNEKKYMFSLIPDDIHDEWRAYVDSRKTKPTKRAVELLMIDLATWGKQKFLLAMENSIKNGWTGLFEPKEKEASAFKAPLGPKFHEQAKWPTVDQIKDYGAQQGWGTDKINSLLRLSDKMPWKTTWISVSVMYGYFESWYAKENKK